MAKLKEAIIEHRADPRLIDERGATQERLRKIRPNPINLALAMDKITAKQGRAAEKLYKHWHMGGMVERIPSVELDKVFGGDGFSLMPASENQAFHRDRYRKAKAKVEFELGGLSFWTLEQIVCYEKSFTEVGAIWGHKGRTRAAQVAHAILIPSLNLLAREWGI